jgi:hypothetical protein
MVLLAFNCTVSCCCAAHTIITQINFNSTSASPIAKSIKLWSMGSIGWLSTVFEEDLKGLIIWWEDFPLRSIYKWSCRWVSADQRASHIKLITADWFSKRLHAKISVEWPMMFLIGSTLILFLQSFWGIWSLNRLEVSVVEFSQIIENHLIFCRWSLSFRFLFLVLQRKVFTVTVRVIWGLRFWPKSR